MKKALLSLSIVAATFFAGYVDAQAAEPTNSNGFNVQINAGGTAGGVPVYVRTGNLGNGTTTSVIIGSQVGSNNAVGGSLISLINLVQNIVARLVPLAIGVAVVSLFFGIIMFMIKSRSGDDKERTKWLTWMGYSIVGLFVMVAVWGLVGFLASVLGVGVGGDAIVPSIPFVAN